MALNQVNPFATNPFKSGQNQVGFGKQPPQIQGPQSENPMYGNAGNDKGKLFEGFSVPQMASSGNSFLGQGALGDNALYGQDNARLGGKLNVVG